MQQNEYEMYKKGGVFGDPKAFQDIKYKPDDAAVPRASPQVPRIPHVFHSENETVIGLGECLDPVDELNDQKW